MKVLCLADKTIEKSQIKDVYDEVFSIYRDNTKLDPQVKVETRNFSNLPFSYYDSEARGISKSFINKKAKEISKIYKYSVDLVDFMVHEDNWLPGNEGIWGWNIANEHHGYEIEQTRWDPNNKANSEGTLYHEIAHSHDSFTYRNIGVWLEKIINVGDWDDAMVHGNSDKYEYIQHDENQDAIAAVASELKRSFDKRRVKEQQNRETLGQIVTGLERVIDLYRNIIINQKKQDIPITKDIVVGS